MKAFPSENNANNEYNWINQGMDLRDYFAAKAMQAIISKQPHLDKPIIFMEEDRVKQVSAGAYLYADAMIKAKEVKND